LLLAMAACVVVPAALAAGGDKGTGAAPKKTSKDYDYYLTGSGLDQRPRAPSAQVLVLMGGGEDVDDAFRAMIAKAGGGARQRIDIVVIRTSGADGYNPYLYAMEGVDSVESFVIKSRDGANDPQVNAIVAAADMLFIAGGDQSTYIALWQGTQLEQTLGVLRSRNVPLGGTSAGLAVLGDVDYTGENGSITSERALDDPYDKRLTLSTTFITGLPGLQGAITDAHLRTRDRMGRFVTFLARMIGDGLSPLGTARGIGIDEATAVVVDGSAATVLGASAAYFVRPDIAPTVLQPRTPLTFRGLRVDRMTSASGRFDLERWTRDDGLPPYFLNVEVGVLTSDQAGGSVY
jgi:cyanophycinase